jgi:fructose-1,6-bisphosphatase
MRWVASIVADVRRAFFKDRGGIFLPWDQRETDEAGNCG